ncbi:LysR family transcriptional regulator [Tritonibacter scottomollicae]|uniref:LysR family transcriptional regulator n=1 Tax=Tritonibacter scottomollicae TaxID=483013 RepID=UPI003AA95131
MIELKDLQLLTALARHRHFAKAAEACHMSQPAFSMRIRSLEDKLGLSIVRRGNRFQGLTGEGQMIVDRARGILDDAKALDQEIAAARGEVTGALVIGAVPTATSFAAKLIDQLHQAHPRLLVRLEVTTSLTIQQRLYDGTLDAGVTYSDSVVQENMSLLPLYDETYVLLATQDMLGSHATSISWADAAKLPLSLLEPQMQNRRILDRIFADLDLRPEVMSESTGFMASMVMARGGSVATILPRALVEALGPIEGTLALPLVDPEPARPICLASVERQPELTTLRALKSVIAAAAS